MQIANDNSSQRIADELGFPIDGTLDMTICTSIAPILPKAAEVPYNVHRYLVGNISAGICGIVNRAAPFAPMQM